MRALLFGQAPDFHTCLYLRWRKASIIQFLLSGYGTLIVFTFKHINKHMNINNVCTKQL